MLNSTKDFHELDFHLFLLHISNESSYLHHGLGDFTGTKTKQNKTKQTNNLP
jgi:hypothetical protein